MLASDMDARELTVQIEAGVVIRVEEGPSAGGGDAVASGVDSTEAAAIAADAGIDPGASKINGLLFSIRASGGVDLLTVTGSHLGFAARIQINAASGAVLSRQRFAPGESGGMLFSADGGANWAETNLTGTIFAVGTDATGAYAVRESDTGATLWRSSDGATWQEISALPLQAGRRAYALVSIGNASVLIGTADGLLRTDDGGASWTKDAALSGPVQYLARADLPGLVLASVSAGPAAGLYQMLPGGAWARTDAPGRLAPFGDRVAVVDESDATARFVSEALTLTSRLPIRTLRLALAGDVWIAATPERIFRSVDQGATWASTLEISNASLLGLEDGTVIVGGFRSPTYRSSDQARTWSIALESASTLCSGSEEIIQLRPLGDKAVIAIHGGRLEWQDF